MRDFEDMTEPHPFDNRKRILNDVMIELGPFGHNIHITDIVSMKPGQGHGSVALRKINDLADKHDLSIDLTAKAYSDDRMSTSQLRKWYKRHGFFDDEDTYGDDYEGYDMKRVPNAS